jgi:hypothetical protein
MARTRMIKPKFYDDETLAEISVLARYLYIGLWCHFDRSGLIEYSLRFFKKCVFPYDDNITTEQVGELIHELIRAKRVLPCEFEGKKFLFCPTFIKHQHFHHLEKAHYKYDTSTIQVSVSTPINPTASTSASTSTSASASTSVDGKLENAESRVTALELFLFEKKISHNTLLLWKTKYGEEWLEKNLLAIAAEYDADGGDPAFKHKVADLPHTVRIRQMLDKRLEREKKFALETRPKQKVRGNV